ncbi:Protein YSC84 [Tolypocladium ophioglossoides CBS 100239]|uniref:Protein YSC84 n=1 Tax=Tolypocladium ophioglossoides (strain CBS 100239) TaxID=1163406 RepID=A0A0L0N123_TOLOC|nr:Protein YSC84 [Tolypocladium ophioglossoides CBS 100239]
MSNPGQSTEGLDGLGQHGGFPPPPPGPPPPPKPEQYQQPLQQPLEQQPQQQPFQQQHFQQQPFQQQHLQQQPSQQQPFQQEQQQYQQQPLQQQHQQHQPYQPQPQQYAIPAYNPAAPVFAPPPNVENVGKPTSSTPSTQPDPHHAAPAKPGWGERLSHLGAKAAAPINTLAHKLGSQSFLPEPLDKECDKAAAILKAFCKKGVYADPGAGQPPTSTHPQAAESSGSLIDPTREKPRSRVLVTIPPKVISRALGLAIFTTLRAGFQFSGATGSGILIARLPDGSWGPPSGIQVHSVGGGFQIGLDIYDCVCVINSREALAAFTNTRVSLGSDLAVVAGPYGAGGAVDFGTAVDGGKEEDGKRKTGAAGAAGPAVGAAPPQSQSLQPDAAKKSHRRSLSASAFKPVFSYVKSRGFYAGVQVDGTVVVERKDANAAFYGAQVAVDQVLKGQVPPPQQASPNMWPAGARALMEVLRGAEAGVLGDSHGGDATTPVAGDHAGSSAPPPPPPPPPYQDDGSHAGVGDVKYR